MVAKRQGMFFLEGIVIKDIIHVFDSETARVLLLSKFMSAQNQADIVTQKSARLVPFVAGISLPASGSRPLLTRECLTSFASNKMNYFCQMPALFSVSFSELISAHFAIKNNHHSSIAQKGPLTREP